MEDEDGDKRGKLLSLFNDKLDTIENEVVALLKKEDLTQKEMLVSLEDIINQKIGASDDTTKEVVSSVSCEVEQEKESKELSSYFKKQNELNQDLLDKIEKWRDGLKSEMNDIEDRIQEGILARWAQYQPPAQQPQQNSLAEMMMLMMIMQSMQQQNNNTDLYRQLALNQQRQDDQVWNRMMISHMMMRHSPYNENDRYGSLPYVDRPGGLPRQL